MFMSMPVVAADIDAEPPKKGGDPAFIMIEGQIHSGDDEKFRNVASEYSDVIVLLNSDGGMIGPAMEIGRTIKLRGYKTAVYKNSTCASACALIWVAGSKRLVFEGGEIGFHASYLDVDGTKLETSVGNALVGHYLSQLGFGESTVVFATLAPPDKILWLNEQTTSISGIDFDKISDRKNQQAPKAADSSQTDALVVTAPSIPALPSRQADRTPIVIPSRYERFMGDAKQTLRSPEAFALALQKKGHQAKVSYEVKGTPMIVTNVGGEDIALGFSDCDDLGCNYVQLADFYNDINQEEAYYLSRNLLLKEGYSHPFFNKDNGLLALYNFIVIGSDGITVQNLIDNMNYFVRENMRVMNIIVQRRAENP